MDSVPQSNGNRADRVFHAVRADILACRIRPWQKLPIGTLTAAYGVSLGAVREALSRLVADGLVVAEPQRGFRAAPVNERDLIDLTEARIAIEGLCLAEAIAHGTVAWEARILAAHHTLHNTPDREDGDPKRLSEAWVVAHAEFHSALVGACANAWLHRLRRTMYEQSERYRRLSVPLAKRERDIKAEHTAIKDATLGRDVSRVQALMREHLSATTQIILEGGILDACSPGP